MVWWQERFPSDQRCFWSISLAPSKNDSHQDFDQVECSEIILNTELCLGAHLSQLHLTFDAIFTSHTHAHIQYPMPCTHIHVHCSNTHTTTHCRFSNTTNKVHTNKALTYSWLCRSSSDPLVQTPSVWSTPSSLPRSWPEELLQP